MANGIDNRQVQRIENANYDRRKVVTRSGKNINREAVYADYWFSVGGNFWISGGDEYDSLEALIPAICWNRDLAKRATIILTSRDSLAEGLKKTILSGCLTRTLHIFSSQYNNYQFFEGMDLNQIENCLCETAGIKNVNNMEDFSRFCEAFMKILVPNYNVSLASMIGMANYENAEILNIARNNNVSKEIINLYDSNKSQLVSFRKVLKAYDDEVNNNNLSTFDCMSHRNITSILRNEKNPVIVVVLSETSHILNRYFVAELENLGGYNLIIDNMSFDKREDASILNFIRRRMGRTNVCTGLCSQDVIDMIDSEENSPKNQIVFQHGDDAQTEKYTGRWKEYDKESVEVSINTPDISFWDRIMMSPAERRMAGRNTKGYTIKKEKELRVSATDLQTYKAALKGHKGNYIELVM